MQVWCVVVAIGLSILVFYQIVEAGGGEANSEAAQLKRLVLKDGQIKTGLAFIIESNPLASKPPKTSSPMNLRETSEIKILSVGLIKIYQLFISPQDGPTCIFTPSCSQFSVGTIRRYGFFRGVLLTSDRLQRCHGMATRHYLLDEKTGRFSDPVESYSIEALKK